MLLSVLIPSRWRFDKLKTAIASWYATASDPECFEVLLRLDADDDESVFRLSELEEYGPNVHYKLGPRKDPVQDLRHTYWEELRHMANGQWHQFWSDDFTIDGKNWDLKLAQVPLAGHIVHPQYHKLGPSLYVTTESSPVPFIPADALEKAGHHHVPNPPDTGLDDIFRIKLKWQVTTLKGITACHHRESDRLLPIL